MAELFTPLTEQHSMIRMNENSKWWVGGFVKAKLTKNNQSLNTSWTVKSEHSHSVTILEAKKNKGNKLVVGNPTINSTIKLFLKCKAENPNDCFNSLMQHWNDIQNKVFTLMN